jgi:hypothetical protein
MRQSVLFWIVAVIVTLVVSVYQRLTGPTRPLQKSVMIDGAITHCTLHRSHGGETDHVVTIETGSELVKGWVEWKRFKMQEPWMRVPMLRQEGFLVASLPHQPPAGKLQYRVILSAATEVVTVPEDEPVTIRFKGHVPTFILISHVLTVFGAMLLSARTGLEALVSQPRLRALTCLTLAFLLAGALVLGPTVQKFAFGAFWTGWPVGHDLTDNKAAVAFIAWLAAAVALSRQKNVKTWVLAAAITTLVVFLIPHSLLGSELDYSTMNDGR